MRIPGFGNDATSMLAFFMAFSVMGFWGGEKEWRGVSRCSFFFFLNAMVGETNAQAYLCGFDTMRALGIRWAATTGEKNYEAAC
jgi:hypothetical protein